MLNKIAELRHAKLWLALDTLPVILLVSTPILWFFRIFMLINALPTLSNDYQIFSVSVCIFGIIVSAVFTANRAQEINRYAFLKKWLLFGLAVTFTVFLYWFYNSIILLFVLSGLTGVFFGLGAPVLLGYFASLTKDTTRSSVSGAAFLIVGFLFNFVVPIESLYANCLILVALMLIAFISLRATRSFSISISNADRSWSKLSSDRTFLLYVSSMLMFMVGVFLLMPATDALLPVNDTILADTLGSLVLAVAVLLSGFLGDVFGRKKIVMVGFFLAALGYGVLSISSYSLGVWLFYKVTYDAALGIIYPMVLFTLWGDLSKKGSPEKYYTVGCLPFIISVALMYTMGPYLAGVLQPFNLYPLLSIFLFAAILPIAYAKEVLPSLNRIQELNEKLRVISNLTRHDINNKLTTVNGHIYMLKKEYPEDPEILDHAIEIEQAVNDSVKIFQFAKLYESIGAQELCAVNVKKAVDEAAALRPNWGFKIVNDCPEVCVLADSFLPQMFYNLLDNTQKYGKKTETARFYFQQDKEGGVQLIYEDDGVGIPKDNKVKLFKEGFSTGGSTGYGLFLIKKMADCYGWAITEDGEAGKGVKFVICIPVTAVANCRIIS